MTEPQGNVDSVNADGEISVPRSSSFWSLKSFRFHIAMLLCVGVFAEGLLRTNLSMVMICLVNYTANSINETLLEPAINTTLSNISQPVNPHCSVPDDEEISYEGSFIWTSTQQALLFSSLSWGCLVTGLPAGWLADRYGPKYPIIVSLLFCIFGTTIFPLAATYGGFSALIAARFFIGLGEGVVFPSITAVVSQWYAPFERSTAIAIYSTGNQLCQIIGLPLSAWLCAQKHFLGGWPAIFYSEAVFALGWCLVWFILFTSYPAKNRFVSAEEKAFISANTVSRDRADQLKKEPVAVPWRKMLLSGPVLACMFSSTSTALLATTMYSYLPTYFKEVLFLSLQKNGFYSALPFLCLWLAKLLMSMLADSLKKKTNARPTAICKCFNSLASFGPAVFLVGVSFLDCSRSVLAIISICCINCFFGAFVPGYMTSLMTIAPPFTGTVYSICWFTGQLGALATPFLVGSITVHGTQPEWRNVFLIVASIMVATGCIFLFFGSAEIQTWALPAHVRASTTATDDLAPLQSEETTQPRSAQQNQEMT